MKPILFSTDSINFQSLTIFIALGFVIFTILLWRNLHKEVNRYTAFDIVLISLILSPLIGRIIYVVQNWEIYTSNGWYILPVRDTVEGVLFLDTMPWKTFVLWDGGINYNFVGVAVILSVLLVIKLSRQTAKAKIIMVGAWKSIIPALIVITLGYLLDGTYQGVISNGLFSIHYAGDDSARLGIQILEIIALLVIWIFYLDSGAGNKKLFNMKYQIYYFPLIWLFVEILIWFKTIEYNRDFFYFDIVQIIWGFAIIIFLLFVAINLRYVSRKRSLEKIPSRISPRTEDKDFNVSFSRFKNTRQPEFSPGERLRQARGRISRDIK